MQQISVSKFKATCLRLLQDIQQTHKPLLVTKKGVPLALVSPPPPLRRNKSAYGSMKNQTVILGDIVSPLPETDWEVLRP